MIIDVARRPPSPHLRCTPRRLVTLDGRQRLVLVLKNDEFVGRSVLDNKQILAEDTLRTMLTYIRPGSTVVEAGGCRGRAQRHAAAAAACQQ
jgi:hypothetical protein